MTGGTTAFLGETGKREAILWNPVTDNENKARYLSVCLESFVIKYGKQNQGLRVKQSAAFTEQKPYYSKSERGTQAAGPASLLSCKRRRPTGAVQQARTGARSPTVPGAQWCDDPGLRVTLRAGGHTAFAAAISDFKRRFSWSIVMWL